MVAKTISVRLDPTDAGRLANEAARLGVSPGTFARILIRAGLDAPPKPGTYARAAKLRALDKRVRAGWRADAPIDSVALVREGRDELERRSDPAVLPHRGS
ncbi:MAG: hypothetical protein ABR564_03670 [Candidatus Dormibacteria bacterium]